MEEIFWVDQTAKKIVERERKFNRGIDTFRTEMGLGASGIPHVGSVGDGIRNYVVNLGLKKYVKSEFFAFVDDMDGLRKVPMGFPEELEDEIGKPVSMIRDPFGCHKTYADHILSILVDAYEKLKIKFVLKRASEEYAKGTFDKEITEILENWKEVGKIIHEITGQEKYLKQLPFLPICKNCGRIYTTVADKFENGKVHYICNGEFTGKSSKGLELIIKGCNHSDWCTIKEGKLAWKVDFAARWRALKINYEAYGKDILDSVKVNDEICRKILKWEPPFHSLYEMFTERGGKKISKSVGNVFTGQLWMKYASPDSLRLLFLKKLGKTRVVDIDTIPMHMDELDDLAKVYFNEKKIRNEKELKHLKRLYEYVNLLEDIKKPELSIRYNLLANLFRVVNDKGVVKKILEKTKHVSGESEELERRLEYVKNWVEDSEKEEHKKINLSNKQKEALKILADELEKNWTEKELENRIYSIADELNISSRELFKGAYQAILGLDHGPRLAMLILAIGKDKIREILKI